MKSIVFLFGLNLIFTVKNGFGNVDYGTKMSKKLFWSDKSPGDDILNQNDVYRERFTKATYFGSNLKGQQKGNDMRQNMKWHKEMTYKMNSLPGLYAGEPSEITRTQIPNSPGWSFSEYGNNNDGLMFYKQTTYYNTMPLEKAMKVHPNRFPTAGGIKYFKWEQTMPGKTVKLADKFGGGNDLGNEITKWGSNINGQYLPLNQPDIYQNVITDGDIQKMKNDLPVKTQEGGSDETSATTVHKSERLLWSGIANEAEQTVILNKHNTYRDVISNGTAVGAGGIALPKATNMQYLEWDTYLAHASRQLADTCNFKHLEQKVNGYGVGQNLYRKTSFSKDRKCDYGNAVKYWYDEVTTFSDRDRSPFRTSHPYGHFTQVVWATTTKVGCACSICNNDQSAGTFPFFPYAQIIACDYSPSGNVRTRDVYEI